jgi:putative PEP-CTERM system histidine kinase
MNDMASSLLLWGYALAALAYGALTVFVFSQGHWRAPVNRAGLAVLAAASLTALWALASGVSVWWQAGWTGPALLDVARYAAWFAFLVQLFRAQGAPGTAGVRTVPAREAQHRQAGPGHAWMRPLAIGLPLLGVLAVVFTAVWTRRSDGGAGALFLAMMLLAVFGLVLVEQLLRSLPEEALWTGKPLCLGLAGIFLFDLYLFSNAVLFNGIDPAAYDIRGLVHAALMPLLLLASTRHREWINRVRVSRQVVFHSATLLLVGAYLLFIAGVGYYVRYFGSAWGPALQLALVFLGLVLLLALAVSSSFRARLRVLLGKHFFRYRYDYRDEWLKFTQRLSGSATPQDMGVHVIRGLADMLESPGGALWMLRADEKAYRQSARWNTPTSDAAEPEASALMAFMQRTGWVVNLVEHREHPDRYEGLALPAWLAQQPQAWLLVPLWLGSELLGFVLLARPRTPMDVNWEVNDLLKTAGRQAAGFLAQMQATEALLEARKFEAFSRMSAFVVHDLKNIVTQLSLMMKNAKRLGHKPEFQADMLMTVEHALERMRQLMLQLREGAAPAGGVVGVALGPIARGLQDSAARRGRQLELDLQPHVATRGHAERLERVVGHLVNNALEATQPGQRVWLKLDRYGSHARLAVGDQGVGMSRDFVRERLFKPFQTTKEAGMGIGVYESFQYVQELGGKVSVDSEEGVGTVVTLLLPLIETHQPSDLQALGEAQA